MPIAAGPGPDHAVFLDYDSNGDGMYTHEGKTYIRPTPAALRYAPTAQPKASVLGRPDFWFGVSAMANVVLLGGTEVCPPTHRPPRLDAYARKRAHASTSPPPRGPTTPSHSR